MTWPLALDDLAIGARFLWGLPSFLRKPVDVSESRLSLRHRLEHREASFLRVIKRGVYGGTRSPYRALLRHAGCEFGDLARLVAAEGVEGALRTLLDDGVYLTGEELKGRRPVVRGQTSFVVEPGSLRNPDAVFHLPLRSSGSRGEGILLGLDLAFIREASTNLSLVLDARGGGRWHHAIWGVPGSAEILRVLRYSAVGAPPVRWFSQIDPRGRNLHPTYRWSARLLRTGSRLAGVRLPHPVHVPTERPLPIVRWMAECLRGGITPHLGTYASAAVRLCETACAEGVDLRGAQLTLGGEPVTAARLASVARSGATAVAHYGSSEVGAILGYGCLAAGAVDDLHFCHDLSAVVQPGQGGPSDLPADTLLFTSIRPLAPLILLNASVGDQALVDGRSCGCPLERLGWVSHIRVIRSYEKLTAGGMTFIDSDVIRVLEEGLPSRFGGGPADYQLVEEETGEGHPRIRLVVHPSVGPLSAEEVADAFLAAIGPGSRTNRVMSLAWRAGGFLRVERGIPEATPGGKVLHFHAPPRESHAAPDSVGTRGTEAG